MPKHTFNQGGLVRNENLTEGHLSALPATTETVEHLLLLCPGQNNYEMTLFNHTLVSFELLVLVPWQTWKARNNFVFRVQIPNPITL